VAQRTNEMGSGWRSSKRVIRGMVVRQGLIPLVPGLSLGSSRLLVLTDLGTLRTAEPARSGDDLVSPTSRSSFCGRHIWRACHAHQSSHGTSL
jgi:hypothetical protein